jgi:hypothetical protein
MSHFTNCNILDWKLTTFLWSVKACTVPKTRLDRGSKGVTLSKQTIDEKDLNVANCNSR